MHGGAITLARLYRERYGAENVTRPQAIVASDMLDLSTFQALTRRETCDIPMAIYFHENQFSYPASPHSSQAFDLHYPFINYASALCADRLYFNSEYHRADFLRHAESFPARFPDFPEQAAADALAERSSVLPLGLDLAALRAAREQRSAEQSDESAAPVILWNHRREHDKNPDDFFAALFELADRGLDFRVMVLGQAFREAPPVFARARERLGDRRILRFAPAETRAEYVRLVAGCDLLPVTAHHDFFGAATVVAMAAGGYPMLPRRLAYPAHEAGRSEYLYDGTIADLIERLAALLRRPDEWRHDRQRAATAALVSGYDWRELIALYDREFDALAHPQ